MANGKGKKIAGTGLNILGGIGKVLGDLDIPVISGLAKNVGGLISSAGDKLTASGQVESEQAYNSEEAEKNREFQRSERLAAQEFNLDMWNRANEYNSLTSQVQRAKDAGVNPNVLFGGSSTGGLANPVTTSPMNGASASFNSGIAPQQLSNSAMISHLMAQTENIEQNTRGQAYDLSFKQLTEDVQYDILLKTANKLDVEFKLADVDIRTKENMLLWYSKQQEADLKLKEEQLNLLYNQSAKLLAETEKIGAETERIEADTERIGAETERIEADTERIGAETERIEADTALKNIELEFSNITGIPINAPEFQVNFKLWKEGKMWDYYNKLAMNAMDSLAEGVGGVVKGVRNFFRSFKQPVSYRNPRFGRSRR